MVNDASVLQRSRRSPDHGVFHLESFSIACSRFGCLSRTASSFSMKDGIIGSLVVSTSGWLTGGGSTAVKGSSLVPSPVPPPGSDARASPLCSCTELPSAYTRGSFLCLLTSDKETSIRGSSSGQLSLWWKIERMDCYGWPAAGPHTPCRVSRVEWDAVSDVHVRTPTTTTLREKASRPAIASPCFARVTP